MLKGVVFQLELGEIYFSYLFCFKILGTKKFSKMNTDEQFFLSDHLFFLLLKMVQTFFYFATNSPLELICIFSDSLSSFLCSVWGNKAIEGKHSVQYPLCLSFDLYS